MYVSRFLGMGLDSVRHVDISRHPALHGVNSELVRHKRGPVSGRDAAFELLEETKVEKAGFRHDPHRVDQLVAHHMSANVWMVSTIDSVIKTTTWI